MNKQIFNSNQLVVNNIFHTINNFIIFKVIVLFCTLAYLTFFPNFYFSYKAYILSLQQLSQMQSIQMANDLARLIYKFPLLNDHIVQIPNQTIDLIYKINGFNNYSEFIYPINKDVEILHQILNSNPEVGSRYSSMILQDIINKKY